MESVKDLKEKIRKEESRLQKLIADAEKIWEETGLDPKDESYLIEKTMRFELAQKRIKSIFEEIIKLTEDYRKLCIELEKTNQE